MARSRESQPVSEIPLGQGVCGNAAQKDQILRVYDVHEFEGHIACDSASRSEIVLPVHSDGSVIAVLDIDSPLTGRFSQEDEDGLREIVKVLERTVYGNNITLAEERSSAQSFLLAQIEHVCYDKKKNICSERKEEKRWRPFGFRKKRHYMRS